MDNKEYIKQWLASKGLNNSQIAGIMGNLAGESGYSNTIHEGHVQKSFDVNDRVGYGIAQWTDPGRKQGLKNYADSKGTDVSDLDTQLEYMMSEIDPDLLNRMGNSSPEQAVNMFLREFERPQDPDATYAFRVKAGYDAIGSDPASFFFRTGQGAYGVPENTPNPEDPTPPPSFWQESKDKFLDSFYDKGTISVVRSGWAALESMASTGHWTIPGFSNYTPSKEEVDFVDKMLPNDYSAQKFVLMNAMSSDHLSRLVAMKREDLERAYRVSNYGYGLSSLATAAGALLDPLLLVPVLGQEAFVAKSLGRLGAMGMRLSQMKMIRYGELAAQNMAIMGGDRYLAERYGGYQPHYAGAMVIGGIAGVATGVLKDLARRGIENDAVRILDGAVDNMESHAIANSLDAPLPSEVRANARAILGKYQDSDFIKSIVKEGSEAAELMKTGRIFVMGKEEAKKAAQELGITLSDDFKAFDIKGTGISVLAKEHVTPETLDGLVAHEIGVHEGLQAFLGDSGYKTVMDEVMKRVNNPQTKEWKRAVKTGGGPEEILGHWIEQAPKNDKVFNIIKSKVDAQLRKLGVKSSVSDEELRDIVQRSVQHQIYKESPIHINPDGSMDVHGIRYSQNNIFNVNTWAKWFDDTEASVGTAQKDLPWFIPKSVGKSLEAGWFWKTPYGVLINSKTNSGAKLAELLGHDYRMRPRTAPSVLPAEKQAEHLSNRWNAMYSEYMDIRTKYLLETVLSHGLPTPQRMRQFDKDVMECFNARYAGNTAGITRTSWEPAVEQAASKVKEIMEDMWSHAQMPSERLGGVRGKGSLVDPRLDAVDHEFYRVTDEDRLTQIVGRYFKTQEEAIDFFADYARQFVKRDVVRAKLERAENIRYEDAMNAWKKAGSKGEAPEKIAVTEDMVDNWIEKESENWARGQIDREVSQLTFTGSGRYGDDTATFLRERFPMDTSGEISAPWGGTFCYDRDLRLTSIDRILPKMIKRTAGEIAIHNTLGNATERAKILDRFVQELGHAERKPGGISPAQRKLEEEAAHALIDRIRGVRGYGTDKTVKDAFSDFVRTKAYGDVGGNMTFAQLAELGGAVAYVGGRILMSAIPVISSVYRKIMLGTQKQQLVEEVAKRAFGEDLRNRVWTNSASYESRSFREVSELGSKMALAADKVNEVAKFVGKLTSFINRLSSLTDRMISEARTWTILDSIDWANGAKFGTVIKPRNPFSEWNLKAIGITDEAATDALKNDIKKYIGSGVANDVQWIKDNPITYFQWKMLVDNNAMRAFVQQTEGNMPMLKEANWFTRMFFQYKDYTFRAVNGQTMRAMTSRQADDVLAALFSMGTNMMAYAGLTYGRAWARFPEDKTKREQYLKEQLAPWRLAVAAFSRGAITGSIPGFATDAYEIATGTPMFRTTVDNTVSSNQKQTQSSWNTNKKEWLGNVAYNATRQLPAAQTINKSIQFPVSAYHLATHQGSKQDIQDVVNGLPLNGWLGMMYLAGELKDHSKLPDKPPKKAAPTGGNILDKLMK